MTSGNWNLGQPQPYIASSKTTTGYYLFNNNVYQESVPIRQPIECVYHLEFIEFPNARPQLTRQAHTMPVQLLDTLDKWVSADGDDEVEIASAAMEMVDYAIEHAPQLFGVDMARGTYVTAEQELALLEKIMECVDGKDYHECEHGGAKWWYQDAVLAVGYPQHRIVVRVSYHEGR